MPVNHPKVSEKDRKIAERIKRVYHAGVQYKQSMQYYEKWAEHARFWCGDQWPAPTEKTQNFPRPVINKVAEIVNQKVAGILHDVGEIHYLPMEQYADVRRLPVENMGLDEGEDITNSDIDAAEALSLVAKHEQDRMEFRDILDRGTLNAAITGTMCLLFSWDNTLVGGGENSKWKGNVNCQEIDPFDIYPEDPSQHEVQKQPGIIIAERLPLSQVKDFYGQFSDEVLYLKAEKPEARIQSERRIEQDETDYVNIYHYWTKEAVEHEIEFGGEQVKQISHQVNYYVSCQDRIIREDKNISAAGLYPIATFQWYPKKKSFFGKSEVDDLIASQKELNRLAGLGLLTVYTTGLPNVVYKSGFINKEDILPGGGGIIEDSSQPGVQAISYMQPPQASAIIPYLRDSLTKGMEDTSGVHEAWTGRAPSAQLNASAIIALQEAAGITIGNIQERLHRCLRDCGRILLSFWKEKWDYERLIRITSDNHPGNIKGVFWFKGTDFADMEFDVKVSSGPSPFSKAIVAATLDHLIQYQAIDGETYLELLPPESFPKVQYILRRQKEREMEARQAMIEQQFQVIEHMAEEVVAQAQAQGVEITPEAIAQLMEMVKEAGAELEGEVAE